MLDVVENKEQNVRKSNGLFLDFDYLGIKIASPEKILSWSYGEVKNSDTINYRTFKPEKDGLFCARIFGPVKDYECLCGKYKRMKYKGIRCEKCDVEVTVSRVRRERMGHINLVYPVLNILYLRSVPSKLSILLDNTAKDIERVVYFEKYIVVDAGNTSLSKYQILSPNEYENAMNEFGQDAFKAMTGSKGIHEALLSFDLEAENKKVEAKIASTKTEVKLVNLRRRRQLIDDFITSGNRPEWMVFTILPVLPPDLRPLVPLDGGKMAISDLNTLYARIINRNNRLKRLMEMNAPDLIIQNECRMLQDAVNSLLNNSSSHSAKVAKSSLGRPLKSISDFLKGKQGRLRQNLLGKRVDYSGRSVIVCGSELNLHQCGLPKLMALELFKPFVLSKLRMYGKATTIRQGNAMIKAKIPEVWEILEQVIREHPVLLNRAPTLHRLGIQAFEPKLIELKAIQVHPLVCRAFNADFDGDQMAVHVPLSIEAQLESRILMLSSNNILSSANGSPMIVPRKDITVGLYYMTTAFNGEKGEGHSFYSYDDVMNAMYNRDISVNTKIKYYYQYNEAEGEEAQKVHFCEETTAGRVLLFNYLPHDGKITFDYLNKQWSIGFLGEIVKNVNNTYGQKVCVIFCDKIMKTGFQYATLSGISFGKSDIVIPEDKQEHIDDVMEKIKEVDKQYNDGYITTKERFNKVTDYWSKCTDELSDEVMEGLKKNADNAKINSITLMMNSGARASKTQMKQLAGMKGLIAKPNGEIIETPVLSNFKEGLSVMEYFNAAHGARKGNVDTALKTADAGYLTRRLVDVAQDCIITEHDCGCDDGIVYKAKVKDGKVVQTLGELIKGRFLAKDVLNSDGEVIAKANDFVDEKVIKKLEDNEISSACVRSPVTCKCKHGICAKCYGIDLARQDVVNIGEAVGVIAAQTIGEPGTQLTLNTFHIGGVVSKKLSESEISAGATGKIQFVDVKFVEDRNGDKMVISNSGRIEILDKKNKVLFSHFVEYSAKLLVNEGEEVKLGQKLAEWDPYNIYLIAENDGKVRLDDMLLNTSYIENIDEALGHTNKVVVNWIDTMKALKPSITILDSKTNEPVKDEHGIDVKYLLSVGAITSLNDGDDVKKGDKLAKIFRDDKNIVKDITGGLPRVEEVFEARIPSNSAVVAGCDGYVEFGKETKTTLKLILHPDDKNNDTITYNIPKGKYIAVRNGSRVKNGDIIINGSMNPHDILKYQGVGALTTYIVQEIQSVYKLQGIDIDSKHIEIIAKYMLNKVIIDDCGGTTLKNGNQYQIEKVIEENEKAVANGLAPAVYHRVLYGISKSSLQTDSFLSAASFQETVKVLTDAAIKGKHDELRGMKESLIVGRLIPAGTGLLTRQYKHKAQELLLNKKEQVIDIDSI